MILSFKTKINGKPTFFVERIHKGLQAIFNIELDGYYPNEYLPMIKNVCVPKIHTIRKDENDRWEKGKQIDFFINARTKNMFRFSPPVHVISTQEVFMTRRGSMLEITIAEIGSYIGGDDFYLDALQQGELSMNDGFDDYNDFRDYFMELIEENGKTTGNYWFKGKIIHWTNYHYYAKSKI